MATSYMVLTRNSETWTEVGIFEAAYAEGAIRQAAEGNTEAAAFVAVPSRSWRPVNVRPQVQTKLVFEEDK